MHQKVPFHPAAITTNRDNQLVYAFWSCLQLERFVGVRSAIRDSLLNMTQ